MYVCSCQGVNDRAVHGALSSGAESVYDLAVLCGAGSGCGGCWPELERLIEEHRDGRATLDRVAV